jgi:hypothetical protein
MHESVSKNQVNSLTFVVKLKRIGQSASKLLMPLSKAMEKVQRLYGGGSSFEGLAILRRLKI